MTIAILYLFAIASAELVTALVNPTLGIAFHIVLLFALIIHASLATRHPDQRRQHLALPRAKRSPVQMIYDRYGRSRRVRYAPSGVQLAPKLYLSLSLAPLIRILSLLMPLARFSQIYWYLMIAVPLLIGAVVAIRIMKFRPAEVGLTLRNIPVQGAVALTGIFFGLAEYQILKPEPIVDALSWTTIWLPALILLAATGFVEELIFRGIIQRSSLQVLGRWGLLYAAGLFSVLYIGYLSAAQWGFALLVGLFFGWVVKRTGSLLGVVLSHGITNIALYLVFPLLIQQGLLQW